MAPTLVLVDGSSAAASWVMSGTRSGDLPNLPATGRTFQVRACSIIELCRDEIAHMIDYWNPLQFQREVGLLQGVSLNAGSCFAALAFS